MRYLLLFSFALLVSCSKYESDSTPDDFVEQDIEYRLTAEGCTVQPYEFYAASSPYYDFGDDHHCDSTWLLRPEYFANRGFRRAGFRFRTNKDTLEYHAQVFSNGTLVLDTVGTYIKSSEHFIPWIYAMVDWNE